MLGTTIVNFWVSTYEARRGKQLRSSLLIADSKHTFSDIYVSLAVMATLVAVQLRFPLLDIVSSLLILVVIFRAGYGIIMVHLGTLVDAAMLDPALGGRCSPTYLTANQVKCAVAELSAGRGWTARKIGLQ